MASPADRLILEWQDVAAGYLRSGNWVVTGSSISALLTDLATATNGNLLYTTRAASTVGTATPANALYPLVLDMAQFNFATGAGGGVVLVVPAPHSAMFLPDGTVDITNPLAAAIIADAIGVMADVAGNPVTIFKSGLKVSRRTEQNG